jgi:DNA-binding PadR family transcriptional regulator
MNRINLGEFEELVLLTTAILHQDAYGISVMQEIMNQTDRKVNISAVHTALDRLEQKGLLKSYLGGATKERGGRRKRYFNISTLGVNTLQEARDLRNALYNQIPTAVFN